jgi:hypothetical protein
VNLVCHFTSVKGRVRTSPRDIGYGESRIVVCWNKTRSAVPGGLLRARLVHRGDPAGAGAGADHPAVAHPDRRGDRGGGRPAPTGKPQKTPCVEPSYLVGGTAVVAIILSVLISRCRHLQRARNAPADPVP